MLFFQTNLSASSLNQPAPQVLSRDAVEAEARRGRRVPLALARREVASSWSQQLRCTHRSAVPVDNIVYLVVWASSSFGLQHDIARLVLRNASEFGRRNDVVLAHCGVRGLKHSLESQFPVVESSAGRRRPHSETARVRGPGRRSAAAVIIAYPSYRCSHAPLSALDNGVEPWCHWRST